MLRFAVMRYGCLVAAGVAALVSCSPRQREARLMARGSAFLQNKDYARAELEFRAAAQAAPRDAEPYYRLGLAHMAENNPSGAAEAFRKATELNPGHAAAQLRLAGLLAAGQDANALADAEKRARDVAAAHPDNADALDTLALTELRLGKPEDASAHLSEALERLPGSLRASALLMRAKLAQGDIKGAEQVMRECVHRSPNSAEAALVLGRFYLVTHRAADAEQQLRRAIRIDPQYAAAWLDLGMTLYHSGRKQEAAEVFQHLAALPGPYKPVFAIFLLESGQKDAALRELERLARADPTDRAARTRLVKMYVLVGRRGDAERLLATALAKNPKDADALLERAELAIDAGQYQDALDDLNLVLRYQPEAATAHMILARLYGAQSKLLNQRQELAEALRLSPALPAARVGLAHLLIDAQSAQAALEVLEQAPEPQRHTVPWIVARNWALIDLGRRDEARRGVTEGLRLARTPELLLEDAWIRAGGQDYRGARASLDLVLRQHPEDPRALRLLARISGLAGVRAYAAKHAGSAAVQNFLGEALVANGKAAEARAAFIAAGKADPDFRPARLALAKLDAGAGNLGAARQSVADLLREHPNDPDLCLYMGWIESAAKNYTQAVTWFRKVIAADPANVIALNNLAYLLATTTGKLDEALMYAQQVKELAPDNQGVDDTIGWVMYRQGLYQPAVRYLESAARGTNDPVVMYHLGLAYLKAGDRRGETTLRGMLKSSPDLPEAQMAKHLLAEMPKSK
ncbi:MAG TPA: tetratricopeptide repeat protein [Bryobacteraceae bacterium]|nr:tetratricopeptide repeat protein [Bryobacteraceae bacterium]